MASAHAHLLRAQAELKAVDLRTTSGVLRTQMRASRSGVVAALDDLQQAIQADAVPK